MNSNFYHKGDQSCDEEEEWAALEEAQQEGVLCAGIDGCAGECADD